MKRFLLLSVFSFIALFFVSASHVRAVKMFTCNCGVTADIDKVTCNSACAGKTSTPSSSNTNAVQQKTAATSTSQTSSGLKACSETYKEACTCAGGASGQRTCNKKGQSPDGNGGSQCSWGPGSACGSCGCSGTTSTAPATGGGGGGGTQAPANPNACAADSSSGCGGQAPGYVFSIGTDCMKCVGSAGSRCGRQNSACGPGGYKSVPALAVTGGIDASSLPPISNYSQSGSGCGPSSSPGCLPKKGGDTLQTDSSRGIAQICAQSSSGGACIATWVTTKSAPKSCAEQCKNLPPGEDHDGCMLGCQVGSKGGSVKDIPKCQGNDSFCQDNKYRYVCQNGAWVSSGSCDPNAFKNPTAANPTVNCGNPRWCEATQNYQVCNNGQLVCPSANGVINEGNKYTSDNKPDYLSAQTKDAAEKKCDNGGGVIKGNTIECPVGFFPNAPQQIIQIIQPGQFCPLDKDLDKQCFCLGNGEWSGKNGRTCVTKAGDDQLLDKNYGSPCSPGSSTDRCSAYGMKCIFSGTKLISQDGDKNVPVKSYECRGVNEKPQYLDGNGQEKGSYRDWPTCDRASVTGVVLDGGMCASGICAQIEDSARPVCIPSTWPKDQGDGMRKSAQACAAKGTSFKFCPGAPSDKQCIGITEICAVANVDKAKEFGTLPAGYDCTTNGKPTNTLCASSLCLANGTCANAINLKDGDKPVLPTKEGDGCSPLTNPCPTSGLSCQLRSDSVYRCVNADGLPTGGAQVGSTGDICCSGGTAGNAACVQALGAGATCSATSPGCSGGRSCFLPSSQQASGSTCKVGLGCTYSDAAGKKLSGKCVQISDTNIRCLDQATATKVTSDRGKSVNRITGDTCQKDGNCLCKATSCTCTLNGKTTFIGDGQACAPSVLPKGSDSLRGSFAKKDAVVAAPLPDLVKENLLPGINEKQVCDALACGAGRCNVFKEENAAQCNVLFVWGRKKTILNPGQNCNSNDRSNCLCLTNKWAESKNADGKTVSSCIN